MGAKGSLKLLDGLLLKKIQPTVKTYRRQIVIPKKLRHVMLKAMHDVLTSGHMGVWKTLASFRNRFFCSRMREDVIS